MIKNKSIKRYSRFLQNTYKILLNKIKEILKHLYHDIYYDIHMIYIYIYYDIIIISLEKGMATHSSILVLGNPMDREAWQITVHGVAKSQTQLSY